MTLILIAVVVAGLIGWGAAQAINRYQQAEALRADIAGEEASQAEIDRRRRALNRELTETAAEIARRKKWKKAGLPVTPLRAKMQALTVERLRIGA